MPQNRFIAGALSKKAARAASLRKKHSYAQFMKHCRFSPVDVGVAFGAPVRAKGKRAKKYFLFTY